MAIDATAGGGGGQSSNSGSAVAQAIGFIVEFNVNAIIFNEVLGPMIILNTLMAANANSVANTAYNNTLQAMGQINHLKTRVSRLEGSSGADNSGFQSRERTDPSGSGSSFVESE